MRFGSLFSGYGGLDMGLQSVLGGRTAWFCEFDKAPSAILAHHWPDVPNLGDITTVDWSQVEPVDVLTGGSPCQDLSHAGKRAGMTEGTRSNLWVQMRECIAALRPRLVVWENVRGALSAPADSDLEPCPGCVGDADDGPVLRALGRVLGDLSELGYDSWWASLRAADVGAAHGRFRVFLFAWPAADAPSFGWTGRDESREVVEHHRPQPAHGGETGGDRLTGVPGQLTLLPTPAVNDMGASYTPEEWDAWTATMQAKHGNGNGHGKSLAIEAQRLTVPGDESVRDAEGGVDLVRDGVAGGVLPSVDLDESGEVAEGFGAEVEFHDSILVPDFPAGQTSWGKSDQDHLLPTPTTRDYKDHQVEVAKHRPDDESTLNRAIAHRLLPTPVADNSRGLPSAGTDYASLANVAAALLPTPMVGSTSPAAHGQISGDYRARMAAALGRWGDYAPAIARWERVIGRPAPAPTEPGKNGNPRLSPAFVEWLMGLPAGHVTDPAIGITRNEQLKALGNGVVPQQAAAATRAFLHDLAQIGAVA